MSINKKLMFINALLLSLLGITQINRIIPEQEAPVATYTTFNIAVLIYSSTTILPELLNTFEKTIKSFGNYKINFTIHNADANYLTLKVMAEEALAQKYDLIWSLGTQPTEIITRLSIKKHLSVPILLTNISAEQLNMLTEQSPLLKKYAIGWGSSYDWPLRIQLIKKMTPHAQRFLFISHNSQEASWQLDMQKAFTDQQLSLQHLNISDAPNIQGVIRNALTNIDAILVLFDSTTLFIDTIIGLADQFHIPLYVADITSAQKGAVCCISPDITKNSTYSGLLAKKILLEKISPNNIPFMEIKDWGIAPKINAKKIASQKPSTPNNILFLMERGFTVDKKSENLEYNGGVYAA